MVKEIFDFKILGGEKAEEVWDKISKVRSMIDEEKMNANMDLFVLTMMMMKAKESRIFSDGEEIVLKQIIKRHVDSPLTIFDAFKSSFKEIKVEGNRKDQDFKESTKEEIHFGNERGGSTTRQKFYKSSSNPGLWKEGTRSNSRTEYRLDRVVKDFF